VILVAGARPQRPNPRPSGTSPSPRSPRELPRVCSVARVRSNDLSKMRVGRSPVIS
jgi:hypothetical protein